MASAAQRRDAAVASGEIEAYVSEIRRVVRGFYGEMPVGARGERVCAREVSRFDKDGFRIENVLFESFPGWEVNATVYVPTDFAPPHLAVVVPVGHSGKQFEDYQIPCQFFARCGYLAVTFDPPGQAGEKQPGNDHFTDGVRYYLVGETSNRYFVADAVRCIDYLETRDDVDLRRGVAMTGVSGGGVTTVHSALLEDRVTVVAPSCCLLEFAEHDLADCYAGCPETHMIGRYPAGIEETDLLCACFPRPLMLMAGRHDTLFHLDGMERMAGEIARLYGEQRFQLFVDDAPHSYTLTQARQFVEFADRWLRGEPGRCLPDLPRERFTMVPYDQLRCRPRTDVHMRSITGERARELEAARSRDPERVREGARRIVGRRCVPDAPPAEAGAPFPVGQAFWQQWLLQPEDGIELPATFLAADQRDPVTILHFDDQGRNRLLEKSGLLERLWRGGANVATVDLRGWGDTRPAVYPYDTVGWGGVDRWHAYASAALGDGVMAMRSRDGLSALAYLRSRPEVDPTKIVLSGSGLGGAVALHVSVIAGDVAGVVTMDCPASFRLLVEAERYVWPHDAFMPNVLLHYDLPGLAGSLPVPVACLRPRGATRELLAPGAIAELNRLAGREVYGCCSEEPEELATCVAALLERVQGTAPH